MKTIRLDQFWIDHLVKLPESGMGYQVVDVELKDHRVIEKVIVLNAEECQTDEKFDVADIVNVRVRDPKRAKE